MTIISIWKRLIYHKKIYERKGENQIEQESVANKANCFTLLDLIQ